LLEYVHYPSSVTSSFNVWFIFIYFMSLAKQLILTYINHSRPFIVQCKHVSLFPLQSHIYVYMMLFPITVAHICVYDDVTPCQYSSEVQQLFCDQYETISFITYSQYYCILYLYNFGKILKATQKQRNLFIHTYLYITSDKILITPHEI